ncbi:MAG: hypothetical protein QOI20_3036 [Acidimicrobiaceae bacterium]|nr:hypothetical protein [Acidimicrobiaceae bacterium]
MDGRELRAVQIAATTRLEPRNGQWSVPSQSGTGSYEVAVAEAGVWHCTCPDHETRLVDCKHIKAVEFTIRRETDSGGVKFTELVKVTYSQDWAAYNKAKTREGEHFPELLGRLCSLIPQPEGAGVGRPRMPLADMAYCMVSRTYSGSASRRIVADLVRAEQDRRIACAPSFNTLLRYTRDPALTPVLHELVAVSSLPLKAVETEFAVDSSGFGTKRTVSWFSKKHGRPMTQREWVKLHMIVGVRTHVVTGVEVTGWTAADSPYLPGLVERTAEHFDVREVSADKGYLTKSNAAAVERAGAVPFMPFKSNTVEPAGDTPWSRMWHYYSYNRSAFLNHYHRRSNVETAFAMIKARFGDDVLGRSDQAQVNEVLCKVVAHNLCVLIQSFYELGIEADFVSPGAAAPKVAS